MRAIDGKAIAIVGGGPGGLTLARLLQQAGAAVTVFERDHSRDARVQGSALDLHEDSGLAALAAAGLTDAFWAHHRPDLDRLRLTDAAGRVLHDHPRAVSGAGSRPEIERGPLRDLLLDSLEPGTVRWDRRLAGAKDAPDGRVRLRFTGGATAVADLVVGADGANSRLRELVTPVRPQDVGVALVEALVPDAARAIPELWALLGGAALIALGGGRTLGMGTKPDGSVLVYAGLKTDGPEHAAAARQALERALDAARRVAWFRAHFPGWDALWEPLFRQAESTVWRPLLLAPVDAPWAPRASITLLGDAAHVMPPYAGEGVNMAMLDALVLSRQLLGNQDLPAALAAYEAEMFARLRAVTADTMANTEMFYAPDAAARVVALFRRFGEQAAARVEPAARPS